MFGINKENIQDAFPRKPQRSDLYEQALGEMTYPSTNMEIRNFMDQSRWFTDPFSAINDPTISGFKLFFHFGSASGLLAHEKHINSAQAYLKRIGQTTRYENLKKFILLLSKTSSECSWLFQDVDGLQEVYSNPKSNVLKESIIDIKTLETVDLKIASLMGLYHTIVWDENRMCYVLPQNLRNFSYSICVHDWRIFRTRSYDEYTQITPTGNRVKTKVPTTDQTPDQAPDPDDYAFKYLKTRYQQKNVTNLNGLCFDFGYAEFMEESGSDMLATVTNSKNEFVTNNIKIHSRKFNISTIFRTVAKLPINADTMAIENIQSKKLGDAYSKAMDSDLSGGSNAYYQLVTKNGKLYQNNLGWLNDMAHDYVDKYVGVAKDRYNSLTDIDNWKTQGINLGKNITKSVMNKIDNQLAKLYLGNVYGFDIGNILQLGENNNVVSQLHNIKLTEDRTQSFNLDRVRKEEAGSMGSILDKNTF